TNAAGQQSRYSKHPLYNHSFFPRVTYSSLFFYIDNLRLEILGGSLQSPCNSTHISLPTSTHLPHSHSITSSTRPFRLKTLSGILPPRTHRPNHGQNSKELTGPRSH